MHDNLVAKANNIDTSGFVWKTKYDTDKSDLEKKIRDADKKNPDISRLAKKTDYNAKIKEIEGKIPRISGLATTTVSTAVEIKIPNVNNLVKKTGYDTEILDIKSKYFATAAYNRFTNEKLDLKIKQKQLVNKFDIAGFIGSSILNKKVATLATKAELKAEQDKITKLEAFDSSYFRGQSHFEDNGSQNYLVFQPMDRYFENFVHIYYISEWKFKGLSDESIKAPTTYDNSLAPGLNYVRNKIRVKFVGNCLKQDKIT